MISDHLFIIFQVLTESPREVLGGSLMIVSGPGFWMANTCVHSYRGLSCCSALGQGISVLCRVFSLALRGLRGLGFLLSALASELFIEFNKAPGQQPAGISRLLLKYCALWQGQARLLCKVQTERAGRRAVACASPEMVRQHPARSPKAARPPCISRK